MQVASLAAITSSPRGTLSSSLMAFCARLRRSRICSACSAKMRPAGVKAIFVPIRSNNDAFSSCSSWRTCALTAGCVRKHDCAALEKLFRRTISRKVWS